MNKKMVLAAAIVATGAAPGAAMAELSANFGWVSDYVFRGVFQEDSSPSAGIDYEGSGFYIGTWGADVGDGLETDLYFGYSGGDDFTYTIGYTGYFYTDDWDDTYQEVNLGIGYGIFALDVAVGEWDGFGTPADYTFTSVTISPEKGPYFTIGSWGQDFDGDYLEVGYGTEVMGIDLSIAMIYSDELSVSPDGEGDTTLVFGISKGITIGGSN